MAPSISKLPGYLHLLGSIYLPPEKRPLPSLKHPDLHYCMYTYLYVVIQNCYLPTVIHIHWLSLATSRTTFTPFAREYLLCNFYYIESLPFSSPSPCLIAWQKKTQKNLPGFWHQMVYFGSSCSILTAPSYTVYILGIWHRISITPAAINNFKLI